MKPHDFLVQRYICGKIFMTAQLVVVLREVVNRQTDRQTDKQTPGKT